MIHGRCHNTEGNAALGIIAGDVVVTALRGQAVHCITGVNGQQRVEVAADGVESHGA